MSDHIEQEIPKKIKIWALAKRTYGLPFTNLKTMTQIFWVPVVVTVLSQIASVRDFSMILQGPQNIDPAQIVPSTLEIVLSVVLFLLLIAVMIGCSISFYRFAILDKAPPRLGLKLGVRELKFFGFSVLMGLIALVFGLVFFLFNAGVMAAVAALFGPGFEWLGPISFLVWMSVFVFFALRLSLVLPFVAIDEFTGVWNKISMSWRLMRGQTVRVLAAFILVFLPFIIVFAIVASIFLGLVVAGMQPSAPPQDSTMLIAIVLLMAVFSIIGGVLQLVLPVSLFSLTCRRIFEIHGFEPNKVAEPS